MTPRGLATRLAGDLDAIVLKALRREPQRRYLGAGALGDDLLRFLERRPVAARPEGRRYRAGKFIGRHRVGIAVAISLVVSLIGGLAATTWQARAKTLEAQKAEAVKTFLIGIFQGADPAQAANRDVSLRQVLDGGAERVQRDLAGQPEVQAELLTVLAGIYGELGIADRSGALTDRARELHEQLYGADSPQVATNLRQKATQALARSDADTADRYVRAALEAHRRAYGDMHKEVAEDFEELANAARQRGRLADALVAAEQSLRIRRTIYGNEHALVARSLNNWQSSGVNEVATRNPRLSTARRSAFGGACSGANIPSWRSRSTTSPRFNSFAATSSSRRPLPVRRWNNSASSTAKTIR